MKIVLILMGSLLTACAKPKYQLERPHHLVERTDPTRSRPEFKYVDGDMPVPPEEPVFGTRIGWSNMPDPNTYRPNGKNVYKATEVKVDVERESEVKVDVERETEVKVDVERETEVKVDVERETEVYVYVEPNTDVESLDSVDLKGS